MEWFFENFSPSGRTNRARYWLYSIVYGILWATAWVVFLFSVPRLTALGGVGTALVIVVGLALVVAGLPILFISIRRLHDREKSGFWIFLFIFAPNLLSGVAEAITDPTAALVLGLASIAISIWAFVELGCLKGTTGPNDFGPDPLENPAGTAAVFQ